MFRNAEFNSFLTEVFIRQGSDHDTHTHILKESRMDVTGLAPSSHTHTQHTQPVTHSEQMGRGCMCVWLLHTGGILSQQDRPLHDRALCPCISTQYMNSLFSHGLDTCLMLGPTNVAQVLPSHIHGGGDCLNPSFMRCLYFSIPGFVRWVRYAS